MSAEKPTDEQPQEGEAQAKPAVEKKPAAAKKPAPKKASVEKSAAAEKAPDAEKASAAKKPATKKPAAKQAEPVAEAAVEKKTPAEKAAPAEKAEKKPTAAKVEEPTAAKAKEPVAAAEAKKSETATQRESAAAPSGSTRKVVRAQARYVRTSARKARMVCGHLRGKSVDEARAILAFTPREVARDWSKLLESAVANAENNHELIEDDLLVREAYADEGPTIKRFRPRAQGRATPIRKRTSHLTITLTPKP
jgi:ribosomal protein L22